MKLIVKNRATEYEDTGTGKALLFLHGWQDDLHTFDPLMPFLSATYRIVRLDLPGFGKTETPQEPWKLDDYVQFVKDFVEKRNLRVDTLIGHSFGGRIAIKAVSTKKLKPNSIILINAAGIIERRTARNRILTALGKIGRVITYLPPLVFWRQALRRKLYRCIGSDYLDARALKRTFLNIIAEDLADSARRIAVPTLLIWGERDTQTPLAIGKRLSELIRGSRLAVVAGAGHFVHREKPQEVARLIEQCI